MWVDHIAEENKKRQREKFDEWLKNCQDSDLIEYINTLLYRNKDLENKVNEYAEFFKKLGDLIPAKFGPSDRIK